MPIGEITTYKPSLLPQDITAYASIGKGTAEALQEVTNLELSAIVERLTADRRATCFPGECALRATCEFVPEEEVEGYADPPNAYPDTTIPAYHKVSITCTPRTCQDLKRTGETIDTLATFVKDAKETMRTANRKRADGFDDAHLKALDVVNPGKQQADAIIASAQAEADRIMSEAQTSADDVLRPYQERADATKAEERGKVEQARQEALAEFVRVTPWLAEVSIT